MKKVILRKKVESLPYEVDSLVPVGKGNRGQLIWHVNTIMVELPNDSYEEITTRLEYLRGELRAERISYGELAELQSLAPYIDKGDVELLEAAGVPEN